MPPPGPNVNILVVDDRPENLISLAAVLDSPGYNIVKAISGREALKHLLHDDFAVILLDVQMPAMDGFETAALIKQRDKSKEIPIIFLTAVSREDPFVFRGYEVGAVDYLVKPFDPNILRSKVAVFVDLYRKSQRIRQQEELLREMERREADFQLKQHEMVKVATIDSALDCIISIDSEGKIIEFNPAAEATFGYRRQEVIGQSMAELIIPPEAREKHRLGLKRYLETGESRILGNRIEMEALRSDGSVFPVEVTVVAIPLWSSPIFTAFLRDITERRRIEAEREQLLTELQGSVQLRDEFLSIASHELRTPLTSLQLQLQLIVRNLLQDRVPPNGRKINEKLGIATQQTDRLGRLIESLLDVSRIAMGRLTLELGECDLNQVVRETVARFQAEASKMGCTITLRAGQGIVGRWDRLRLEQVLTNLLSNAIKYGSKKPIEISVSQTESEAQISIRDQGIGIRPEDVERIFGRFERAVSSRNYGGLGLGLYITREIVRIHGGSITVESELEKGSTFTVRLPLTTVELETETDLDQPMAGRTHDGQSGSADSYH